MTDQTLILVDEKDNFLGYASRDECHRGQGKRHRAFVILLFDSQNRVFLQKRKHKLFDNLWDLTAISHLLHTETEDETYQQASDRALKKEMGIDHVDVSKTGAFNYFVRDGKNCENEYCAILVGNYDGKLKPNKSEVYEIRKIKFSDFLNNVRENPKKYTPWARLAAKELAKSSQLFQDELKQFLTVFEPYAKKYFEKKIEESSKYAPLIRRFYEDLADFSKGGKRLRAFLAWLGYRVVSSKFKVQNSKLEKVLPICLAVELFHSFLLIHDDIIDKSDTRRGKPTIHRRYEKIFGPHYGLSQAIVIGDIACFEAFELVVTSDFESDVKVDCLGELVKVLVETGFGEALDVENSYREAKLSDIWQVTDLKTARYSFAGPLTVGAKLAGASDLQCIAIQKYGESAGKAFQIQDDILGVFGDEKVLGKSTLSDMREGKNTVLIYKTKELASAKQKNQISGIWGRSRASRADLITIKKIIEISGALEWCKQEKAKVTSLAVKFSDKITSQDKFRKIFVELVQYAVSRQL